jgi:hypothetical protein
MTALRDDVAADRRFELVPSSCAPNCPTEGPALGDRLRAASQAGTQILIIGIVQKRSTLVQLVWIAAIDTTTQRVVFKKFFTFRGDNDEAWQRAERFVSEEVRDRLLESSTHASFGTNLQQGYRFLSKSFLPFLDSEPAPSASSFGQSPWSQQIRRRRTQHC